MKSYISIECKAIITHIAQQWCSAMVSCDFFFSLSIAVAGPKSKISLNPHFSHWLAICALEMEWNQHDNENHKTLPSGSHFLLVAVRYYAKLTYVRRVTAQFTRLSFPSTVSCYLFFGFISLTTKKSQIILRSDRNVCADWNYFGATLSEICVYIELTTKCHFGDAIYTNFTSTMCGWQRLRWLLAATNQLILTVRRRCCRLIVDDCKSYGGQSIFKRCARQRVHRATLSRPKFRAWNIEYQRDTCSNSVTAERAIHVVCMYKSWLDC